MIRGLETDEVRLTGRDAKPGSGNREPRHEARAVAAPAHRAVTVCTEEARHGRLEANASAKARSGSGAAVVAAAIITADRLGMVPDAMGEALAGVTEPLIFGGGRPVGAMTLT